MDPTATRRGTFEARVLAVVRRIPSGRVATYGDIAALAGRPRAWRAVGTIMRTCRFPTVPCHRVIAAGGRLQRLAAEAATAPGRRDRGRAPHDSPLCPGALDVAVRPTGTPSLSRFRLIECMTDARAPIVSSRVCHARPVTALLVS
ncbi:MAG: MGMT family protein [Acidobacteria bacterium]|nr:MAG: MGMT family protein [Acidobacteriota bacterium]